MSSLSIKTTARCKLHCRDCPVVPWMKSDPEYQLELGTLRQFLKICRECGYVFGRILLGGGEPLLWDHLEEGLDLLIASKVARKLEVLTSGAEVHRRARLGLKYGRHVRWSINPPLVNHWQLPSKSVRDSLPAHCGCTHYSLIYDRVEICGLARFISVGQGRDFDTWPECSVPIASGFLEHLESLDRFNRWWCTYCIANRKVQRQTMRRPRRI